MAVKGLEYAYLSVQEVLRDNGMENLVIKNVYVIEDEKEIALTVKAYLEEHGYRVSFFLSAEEFYDNYQKIRTQSGAVYLVDWNLPGDSGIDVVKRIRLEDKISPIFILSARCGQDEVIEGLNAGADDYLTKPFSFEELVSRVNNAYSKFQYIINKTQLEDFRLLPEANSFIKSGVTVSLTAREYILFDYLVEQAGNPVSRDELIKCFNNEEKMTNRNVDVHIFSLRKKLKKTDMHIETVWGKGYKLLKD